MEQFREDKRIFRKQIFLGNGERSQEEIDALYEGLEIALEILGGLQQPDHPESEMHAELLAKYRKIDEESLEIIAADIYCALTGKEPK